MTAACGWECGETGDGEDTANAKNNLLKGDEEEKAAEAGEKVATVQEQGLNF